MRRWLVASVALVVVAGCGGAVPPGGDNPGGGNPGSTSTPAGGATDEPLFTLPVGTQSAGRTPDPTDGLIQLVNLYVPGDEPPFGVDVYHMRASPYGDSGSSYPIAGDQPIAHADFGAATQPFDPGQKAGSESFAVFKAGLPPTEANSVWNFPQNFNPGERITELIFSSNTDPTGHHTIGDGRRDDKDPALNGATPPSTGGFLVVESSGLDQVWGPNTYLTTYVKLGDKCLDYDTSPGQPQPAGVGSLTVFTVAAGSAQAVVYARDPGKPADCSGDPSTAAVDVTIPNGGLGFLFLYASKPGELKSFFEPAIP